MNNFLKKFNFKIPWDQKIAFLISKPFIFFKIHPNIVTIIGVLIGVLSGFLFSTNIEINAKIASILFFIAATFDHVDGLVARKLNKTSVIGHYLDHIGVCITYISMFIGLGILIEKSSFNGLKYGITSAICIFLIMTIRFYLERKKGGIAIKQSNFLGFEQEDILYLIIPITFLNKINDFLYFAYIGAPIFLIITIIIFFYKMKKL
tara:strand:- start:11947 stop:12564 length:618 start_codon:yes stop_codon:yes gene_type:complete